MRRHPSQNVPNFTNFAHGGHFLMSNADRYTSYLRAQHDVFVDELLNAALCIHERLARRSAAKMLLVEAGWQVATFKGLQWNQMYVTGAIVCSNLSNRMA